MAEESRCFEQSLEHAGRTAVLKTLVRGQTVFGAVTTVAELTHVKCVRLLMFILEVAFKGVVATEGAATVGAVLGFVYPSNHGRWHHHPCNKKYETKNEGFLPHFDCFTCACGQH